MAHQIIVFGSKDDPFNGWKRAQTLFQQVKQKYPTARLIQKTGFNLEDLRIVARHRVVSTPTILVLDQHGEVLRSLWLPPLSVFQAWMATLQAEAVKDGEPEAPKSDEPATVDA